MKITPEVGYFPSAIFDSPWSGEDFESGINFDYSPLTDTTFVRVLDPAEAFEGASGLAYLTENHDFFEARTPTFSDIPRNGTDSYLEFDYKSTHNFAVSVYVNGSTQTAISFFRSRATYSKIYVKLTPVFSTNSTAINFSLAFTVIDKPLGEIGKFYIDNVKLVRY